MALGCARARKARGHPELVVRLDESMLITTGGFVLQVSMPRLRMTFATCFKTPRCLGVAVCQKAVRLRLAAALLPQSSSRRKGTGGRFFRQWKVSPGWWADRRIPTM